MADYILLHISDDTPVEGFRIKNSDNERNFPPDLSQKGWKWVPVVKNQPPTFDSASEVIEKNDGILGGDYVFGWTKRSKTQAELDSDVAAESVRKDDDAEGITKSPVGKAMFMIVNEIQSLKSQPQLTADEFKIWFRSQQDA